jgi:radical SAM protein with 4Fe4S-binding SPASM domain
MNLEGGTGVLLYLNEDVFVVTGPAKHALYNLATGKLYSINDKVLGLLQRLQDAGNGILPLREEEMLIRRFLEMERIYPPAVCPASQPCKAGSGEEQPLSKRERRKDKPALGIDFAWLEVTDRCNLKCRHCYEEAHYGAAGKAMSWEDYRHVIDELKANGIKMIQFIGGEPMLNPKLKDMISYARPDFQFIEVFTNATLINAVWASFYKENAIQIATSVYSYDGQEHDKVTGVAGAHAKTTRALALLKEKEVPFRTATVCMDGVGLGEKKDDIYSLDGKQDPARLVGRANLRLMNQALIEKKMITRKNYFSRYLDREAVLAAIRRHNCFGAKLYVAAGLDVYPCVMERRFRHGNLRNTTLKELLQPEILELTKDKIEGCRDCEYRYACYDCRPDSMGRDQYAKPWYCAYDPDTGAWDDKLAAKVLAGQD